MGVIQSTYKFLSFFSYKSRRAINIVRTKWRLIGNGVQFSRYRIVGIPIIINKGGRIVFGDNLQLNNGLASNQIGINTPCVFRAENGSILIGKNVGISQSALVAKGADIVIGDNVKLGGGVKIYTTDFHCLDYRKRRDPEIDLAERKYSSVSIEDDCFIGAGSFVLKGVTIGARSIIGAGSVVTKSIPADCMAAGNPCRIIKSLTDCDPRTLSQNTHQPCYEY